MEKTKEQIIAELNKISAKNASHSMKISRMLFLTKDGKPYSDIAEDYAIKLKGYNVYCKEDSKELWNTHIDKLMEKAGTVSDEQFCWDAGDYESTGEMLELLSTNPSWDQVHKLVREQGHSGCTISSLAQLVLLFSDRGIEFVEKEIGGAIKIMDNLNSAYKKVKKREKKALYQRLINTLASRLYVEETSKIDQLYEGQQIEQKILTKSLESKLKI